MEKWLSKMIPNAPPPFFSFFPLRKIPCHIDKKETPQPIRISFTLTFRCRHEFEDGEKYQYIQYQIYDNPYA